MLKRVAKEPLFQFLVIGAALFIVFEAVDDSPAPVDPDSISIGEAEVNALSDTFQRTWRRPPNETELAALVEDRIREEVFVREAVGLGLDQNDAVIRRRLRQKMEFLTSSLVEAMEPADATIREYFEAHREDFKRPGRVAFRQVFLGENPGDAEIGQAIEALRSGSDPATVGVRSLIPPDLPQSPEPAVDGTFGRGFFQKLAELPDRQWAGPVTSGYGAHLVFITGREPATVPPLDEIRENVVRAWREEMQKDLLEEQYQKLRTRYDVSVPATGAGGDSSR